MKNKKYISFILVLIILLVIPNTVNAKFTIDEAEKQIGTNQTYMELLDADGKTIVCEVLKGSTNNTNYFKYSYEYDCNNSSLEKLTLHTFTQLQGLKKDFTVETKSTKCEVTCNKKTYDNSGYNGVELELELTPSSQDSQTLTYIKWKKSTGDAYNPTTEAVIEIRVDLKNNLAFPPESDATPIEIEDYFNSLIEKCADTNTPIINKLLEIDGFGSLFNKWSQTIDTAINELEANRENNETIAAKIEFYEEINDFLKQATQERANGNTTNQSTDTTFNQGDDSALTTASNKLKLIEKKNGVGREYNDTFNDVFDDLSYYNPSNEDVSSEVTDKVNIVLTIITNIGMILAVLIIAILGIKYMLGSVEEKADYKKDLIPYLVGAMLLFGITTIVKVLQQLGQSINNI